MPYADCEYRSTALRSSVVSGGSFRLALLGWVAARGCCEGQCLRHLQGGGSVSSVRKVLKFDSSYFQSGRGEAPAYSVAEAAHYLRIPKAALRAWVARQDNFRPVIDSPRPSRSPALTFVNLVEIHVLDALRRQHQVSPPKIRKALRHLARAMPGRKHPLAAFDIHTDGFDVLVDQWGGLGHATGDGQIEMRHVLEAYLRRVERGPQGSPIRLYPFTRKRPHDLSVDEAINEPRHIVIDPHVAFGRPVLVGTGIPTEVIAERYKAGESMDELAEDYDRPRPEIEEAIRCELAAA
jgi:uncharacterized protein (DUF433 family)